MTIISAKLPRITKELVEALDKTFRPEVIDPTTGINKIMYSAGQRSVIDWLRARQSDHVLTGNPDAINREL